ncbi:hypothetical protein [uncultured Roseobacter sp.]|nr:hypothetical protein [uncultured Roseobacter sp.]
MTDVRFGPFYDYFRIIVTEIQSALLDLVFELAGHFRSIAV